VPFWLKVECPQPTEEILTRFGPSTFIYTTHIGHVHV